MNDGYIMFPLECGFTALSPILKTLCILINGQFQKTGQIRGYIGQGVHKITTRRPFSLL